MGFPNELWKCPLQQGYALSHTADLFIPVEQVGLTGFLPRNPGLYNQPTVITPESH